MVTPSNLKECTCSTILLLKDKASKGDQQCQLVEMFTQTLTENLDQIIALRVISKKFIARNNNRRTRFASPHQRRRNLMVKTSVLVLLKVCIYISNVYSC